MISRSTFPLFFRVATAAALAFAFTLPEFNTAAEEQGALTAKQLEELELKAIESRRAIASGEVHVDLKMNVFSQDPSYVSHKNSYTIYFDGDKWRSDHEITTPDTVAQSSVIYTDNLLVRADSSESYTQVFGPTSKPAKNDQIPNVKNLGYVAWPFDSIGDRGIDQHLLRADSDNLEVRRMSEGGVEIVKVKYDIEGRAGKATTEYWLDPAKNYQPVYISVVGGEGENRHENSLTVTLNKYGEVWFPQEVVFRAQKGDAVLVEEVATVRKAQFGKPIDPKIFTLSGLNLPVGKIVSNDGKLMFWTGSELVAKTNDQETYQGSSLTSIGGRVWLLLINGIVCAAIAVILIVRKTRQARVE